jgi:hypothetical protein
MKKRTILLSLLTGGIMGAFGQQAILAEKSIVTYRLEQAVRKNNIVKLRALLADSTETNQVTKSALLKLNAKQIEACSASSGFGFVRAGAGLLLIPAAFYALYTPVYAALHSRFSANKNSENLDLKNYLKVLSKTFVACACVYSVKDKICTTINLRNYQKKQLAQALEIKQELEALAVA